MRFLCIIFFVNLVIASKAYASGGFLDFNYYHDTRDFNVFTINALGNINERLHYFSLTNYFNAKNSTDNEDKTNFFTEQNLRYSLGEESAWDLTGQSVMQSSANNDQLRLGLRFRPTSLPKVRNLLGGAFSYSVTFYLVQFDTLTGYNWQMEHVYHWKIYEECLYLAGFLDHNVLKTGDKIVTEHQVGLRAWEQLFVVAEYRLNEYFNTEQAGWGLGLQYKLMF